MRYEQYDKDGNPIKCANGSDAAPCYRRPELALRQDETWDSPGQILGSICGECAADLIAQGKARRSTQSQFRIVLTDRYHPVVVDRYIGDYMGKFTCWSIADSTQANRTNGEKYDTYEQAKKRADELNNA